MNATLPPEPIGQRYRIERELGRGAMGVVYLARDLRHDREVALKVLRPLEAAGVDEGRFTAEIRTAARLTHPHILPVHDSGSDGGVLWYVMPRVQGESLDQCLRRNGPLPVEEAVDLAGQVAGALAYAHGHGVVHRDVKPANILLDGAGHAYLADFGLARALTERVSPRRTAANLTVGSPLYMSPEQAAPGREVDSRSDLYSLGCVLYEMLAGEAPFPGEDAGRVLARHANDDVPSLRRRRADVPPALEAAIRTALAKDPAERFPTAAAFASAIRAATGAAAPADAGSAPRAGRAEGLSWRPRRRSLLVAGALAAVAATAIVLRPAGGHQGVDRELLAVFPFRSIGDAVAGWAEGVPDLLATTLDGAEGLRVADPWSLWRPLRPTPSARPTPPSPDEAARLAARAGAGRYMLGSVVDAGDSVTLSVRLYEVGRSEPVYVFPVSGEAGDLAGAVRGAAVGALGRLATEDHVVSPSELALAPTRSPEALKAYLAAREALRRGLLDSASLAIDRAVAADSTFVLALVEAIGIKSWLAYLQGEQYQGLLELLSAAAPFADDAAPRTRLRLEATAASVRTDGPAAMAASRQILSMDSTDLQAWAALTYYLIAYGWQVGARPDEAVAAAERVVRLDSTYVPGLVVRASLAMRRRDSDDIRAQLRRLELADTSSPMARGILAGLRVSLADETEFRAMLPDLARLPGAALPSFGRELRQVDLGRTRTFLSHLQRTGDPNRALLAAGELARIYMAQGWPARLDSMALLPAYRGEAKHLMLRAMQVAASLAGSNPGDNAGRAAAELAAFVPLDSVNDYFLTRPVWGYGWLVGAYNAAHGDTTLARRWAAVFDTMPVGGSPPEWGAALAADIDARLAARQGRDDRAFDRARDAFRLWSIHTENDFEFLPEPSMRLNLAIHYVDRGMADSARALLTSLASPNSWFGFLTPRAHYEIGSLDLAAGLPAAATRRFERALEFWGDGGPAVEPWRDLARRRLPGELAADDDS